MRSGHKNKTQRRKFLCMALIVFAIVARAAIPLGYMPGNALAGEFLVLCPQGLPQELVAALHHGHSSDEPGSLDVDSACPIGQGLNYDVLPASGIGLSAAPAVVDWDGDTLVVFYIPSFERHYASRAPPLI